MLYFGKIGKIQHEKLDLQIKDVVFFHFNR